jgi:hypothetical protein
VIGRPEPSQGDGYKISSPHGYIDYRPVDGTNEIWWVESNKRGHGSQLVDAMMKHHPAEAVAWGATSEAGEGLRKKWHRNNPQVADATGGERVPFEGQFDPFDDGGSYVEDEFYLILGEVDRYAYRSAAIYHKNTGQVFEGPMHLMAHDAAARAGHPDAHNPHMWDDGFVTEEGDFEDREGRESVNLMSSGKLPLAPRSAADRPDIRPEKAAQLRAIHLKKDSTERHSIYRSASIRNPKTGQVFEGAIHVMARDNALEAMGKKALKVPWIDGFTTHEGEFHTREEASRRTNKNGESVSLLISGHLDSPELRDLIEEDPEILSDNGFDTDRFSIYRSAAVKHLPTGQIFEGSWHGEATTNAREAGVNTFRWDDLEDGFVTHEGEYHNRERAGEEAKKVAPRAWGETVSMLATGLLEETPRHAELGFSNASKNLRREYKNESDESNPDRHFYDRLDELDRHADLFRSAAIRDPDTGTIHEGTWHGHARDNAEAAGVPYDHLWEWEDGFVGHNGRFYNRDEATELLHDHNSRSKPESIDLMTKGHLPVDESLTHDEGVAGSLRRQLANHLGTTSLEDIAMDDEDDPMSTSSQDRYFYEYLSEIDRYSESFRSAAIKHKPTGQIFEGTWHEHARQLASEEGHDPWSHWKDWEDGFMTHDGDFLDRDEAANFTSGGIGKPGGRESVDLMIKGHLPVDESLVEAEDLRPSLRRDLETHLRSTGRISEDTPLINKTPAWLNRKGQTLKSPSALEKDLVEAPFADEMSLDDADAALAALEARSDLNPRLAAEKRAMGRDWDQE